MSEERFCKTVESFQKHIRAGDIFQGVPSQRFSFALPAPPLDIYRCLRRMNPSPYMFYLKCGGFVAAGASPELMLDCRNGKIELRPIAGTRPRGDTPAEDARLEKELLGDEKEIAEHLMLVDLGATMSAGWRRGDGENFALLPDRKIFACDAYCLGGGGAIAAGNVGV